MLEGSRAVKRARIASGGRAALACLLLWAGSGPAARADDVPAPASSSPAAIEYAPGSGLRIGDTGLVLGGYSNLNVSRDEGQRAHVALDDLSVFVAWTPTPRLHLFSELEYEDLFDVDDHGEEHGGRDFTAERLYGDFSVSDALTFRVGKFLTPIGRWNLIHAQPLVWTTSRPLATELPFDPHTTGAMAYGSVYPARGTLAWALYGQFVDQFSSLPVPQRAQRSGGGRVEWTAPAGWSAGASYQAAQADGDWRHVGGVDAAWAHGPFEVMGEAIVEDAERKRADQWGLYLQGVVEVLDGVHLVGRYEHYAVRGPAPSSNLFVGGVAYKPRPWLVVKVEYLAADHPNEESPPGFKASLAVLF